VSAIAQGKGGGWLSISLTACLLSAAPIDEWLLARLCITGCSTVDAWRRPCDSRVLALSVPQATCCRPRLITPTTQLPTPRCPAQLTDTYKHTSTPIPSPAPSCSSGWTCCCGWSRAPWWGGRCGCTGRVMTPGLRPPSRAGCRPLGSTRWAVGGGGGGGHCYYPG
jgi:hypothetical protein